MKTHRRVSEHRTIQRRTKSQWRAFVAAVYSGARLQIQTICAISGAVACLASLPLFALILDDLFKRVIR